MEQINANIVLDAKGLACPMPIVKTKKAMKEVLSGQVIEIQATDKGSKADIKAWAQSTGHYYLGTIEEGDVLKHYLRKSSGEDKVERKHPNVSSNEELELKLDKNIVVLDVRESAEFAFNHIPNAKNIPLGDLEVHANQLNKDDEIYVICRTGSRSDLASQKLTELGFTKVINVVPGMSEWSGIVTSIENEGGTSNE